ncbi:hypothetical protein AB0B25_25920 [Nocardia sp. NPDC049190]|uniref:hypothetical protein n=1 Tax=Nocardia sp. NPDC049190 TaxID=3155650 RepID=UPI00340797D6
MLPEWRRTTHDGKGLADALERLRAVATEHMALEEAEILPLATKYVTVAEWAKLGEHSLADTPKKDLPLSFGMAMYEGDPQVIKAVLAHAPGPAAHADHRAPELRQLLEAGPRCRHAAARERHGPLIDVDGRLAAFDARRICSVDGVTSGVAAVHAAVPGFVALNIVSATWPSP